MGQYHLPVNLTKREFIMPHQLGNGLKLWEQTGEESVAHAVMMLLNASIDRGGGDFTVTDLTAQILGRWVGDVVVWMGDYSEYDDMDHKWNADLVYSLCQDPEDGDAFASLQEWHRDRIKDDQALIEKINAGEKSHSTIENCEQHIAEARDAIRRVGIERKRGSFKNISEEVGQAMEETFGFKFTRDSGWRKRLYDRPGYSVYIVDSPLGNVAYDFPGAICDYPAGTKFERLEVISFDRWMSIRETGQPYFPSSERDVVK